MVTEPLNEEAVLSVIPFLNEGTISRIDMANQLTKQNYETLSLSKILGDLVDAGEIEEVKRNSYARILSEEEAKEETEVEKEELKEVIKENQDLIKTYEKELAKPPATTAQVKHSTAVAPPKKSLTELEKQQLKAMFNALLMRELKKIPAEALEEFNAELDTVALFPFSEAQNIIDLLAQRIINQDTLPKIRHIPKQKAQARKPEAAAPEEGIEEGQPVRERNLELPLEPLSKMRFPFPRAPSSEEQIRLWNYFSTVLEEQGIDAVEHEQDFNDYIRYFTFTSWNDLTGILKNLIKDISRGKAPTVPFSNISNRMGWKKLPYDPIVHFASSPVFATMDELLEGLAQWGIINLTPQTVKENILAGWKNNDIHFLGTSKERLEKIIGEKLA
jgi:hypothetical protein